VFYFDFDLYSRAEVAEQECVLNCESLNTDR